MQVVDEQLALAESEVLCAVRRSRADELVAALRKGVRLATLVDPISIALAAATAENRPWGVVSGGAHNEHIVAILDAAAGNERLAKSTTGLADAKSGSAPLPETFRQTRFSGLSSSELAALERDLWYARVARCTADYLAVGHLFRHAFERSWAEGCDYRVTSDPGGWSSPRVEASYWCDKRTPSADTVLSYLAPNGELVNRPFTDDQSGSLEFVSCLIDPRNICRDAASISQDATPAILALVEGEVIFRDEDDADPDHTDTVTVNVVVHFVKSADAPALQADVLKRLGEPTQAAPSIAPAVLSASPAPSRPAP